MLQPGHERPGRDVASFVIPCSIAVVGADERVTSFGSTIMPLLRQTRRASSWLAADTRVAFFHCTMGTLPNKTEWFAEIESAGITMFDDAEEMAEMGYLMDRSGMPSAVTFRGHIDR